MTQSYYGHLIAKKPQWLQDKDFHQKDDNRKPAPKPTIANGEKSIFIDYTLLTTALIGVIIDGVNGSVDVAR